MDRHYRHRDSNSRTRARSLSRPRSRSRSRSRSPDRSDRRRRRHHHHHHHHSHSHNDRHKHKHSDKHAKKTTPTPVSSTPVVLPFNSRELTKHDLTSFEPLFAMYLDIQKGILLEDLPQEEINGRWKSFVRKWNRGELAEGWYDPEMLEKARRNAEEDERYITTERGRLSPDYDDEDGHVAGADKRTDFGNEEPQRSTREYNGDEEEEEDYGPELPTTVAAAQGLKQSLGPTIANLQDLELRRETAIEDAISARQQSKLDHRAALQSHRAEIKEMQDFVAPRAEPGTHERRLEKRWETAAANRAFAESSRRGGSPVEAAPDEELMGSGENDLEALKKAREREKRKKNEREIRREEILRARAAEREERVKKYRQKEEETVGWLKALAKQRFG